MEYANATMGMSSLATISPVGIGILVGVITFITIITLIFVLSKNFRRFCYGLIIIVPLAIVGLISKTVGVKASEGDFSWFSFIIKATLFVIISTLIGYFLQKNKKFKEYEKKYI